MIVQLNYHTININSGIILCINILVDICQGDSCDDDDSEGNESLIQELKLDADQVFRLPPDLLESPPQQESNSTDASASTPGTGSEETDKVISLQYSYNNLTFK